MSGLLADPRAAVARVPFTCGELVQGTEASGTFLVSCPIDRYAEVYAVVDDSGTASGPADRPKALAAARRTLASLDRPALGVRLRVRSDLPVGRGFGTSTADVVGAIAATARALDVDFAPEEIARLAVAVEPSDGTMFPGLAVFEQATASHSEVLGPAPALAVVVLDFGGTVDTIAHHGRQPAVSPGQARVARRALDLVRRGVRTGDPAAIGAAATLSAIANEPVLPKPALIEALELAACLGGFGVCAAHSGTALGLLLPPDREIVGRAVAAARRTLSGLVAAWPTRLVDGGVRISPGDVRVVPGDGVEPPPRESATVPAPRR